MSDRTNIVNTFNNTPVKRIQTQKDKEKRVSNNEQEFVKNKKSFLSSGIDSPLLFASKEIFKETYRLMYLESSSDVRGISNLMSHEINQFSNMAMEQGVSSNHLHIARYILCTFIDEMLASSKWALDNDWAGVSLLSRYYQESYGGNKFFELLLRFEQEPTEYIYLMELSYVCLSFGYGGKYKQQQKNTIQDLASIKENLYRQIKITKPEKEKFYTSHPAAQRHHKLYSKLSRRIIMSVSLFLLVIIYSIFTYTIHNNENELIKVIQEEHKSIKENHGNRE